MPTIKLKDPLKSLIAKQRARLTPNPYFGKQRAKDPHNIGGVAPGERRNPTGKGGFGDNPPEHVLEARRRGQIKPGECRNPYGRAGYKSVGIQKVEKRRRSPESESIVMEAREVQQEARKHAKAALDRVAKILGDEAASDMAAIAAYHAIMDRAYGKATQTNVNANMDLDSKVSELSQNEIDRRIAETLERAERLTKRKRETLEGEDQPPNLRKLN